MRIRHLIAFLLVVGLGVTGAMAASYTVYPTTETYGTGTTTYDVKTGGEVLIYAGVSTGSTRKASGFFKFDITSVPDVAVPTKVEFHFYVNAAYWPYWSVTPVTLDPNFIGTTAATLWDDVTAEDYTGYYNYQSEPSDYGPGWKMLELGGTALTDITAALSQDWFALGAVDRLSGSDFHEIDGNTDTNLPYLVVSDDPIYEPPTGLTCALNGVDVDLTWTNGPTAYDSIDIYEDDIVIDSVLGTDVAYTVVAPLYGVEHCYKVCGVVSAVDYCSTECCLLVASCDDVLVDLGQIVCPGSPLTASGDTTGAADYCADANGDHHYSFEVVASGDYEISLCDTLWDTRLYLYNDACCGTQIGYDDDGCDGPGSGLASVITITLDPGVYYVLVGGFSANEGIYDLEISCVLPDYEPTGLTCVENVDDVDLTWVNDPVEVYDSITVYDNDVLVDTLLGTDTSYTVLSPGAGGHCWTVCGVISAVEYCSAACCLTLGTCDDFLVDLGTIGCPGTLAVSDDTTGAGDFCVDLNGDHHYQFEVTAPGSYEISLCAATWDTRLYVYDDACCGNQVGYDDDGCEDPDYTLASVITMDLYPGTYYVQVGGYGSNEGAYDLAITCLESLIIPPLDVTCTENGVDVDLTWTNGEPYDSIEVYADDVSIATLTGTDTTYTVLGVAKGPHCYRVCGVITLIEYCSADCCGIFGYDNVDLLWDFEADDGGLVTDGTTGWQWGAPTYGPCFDTADGNVWATDLDADYLISQCLLLDTPVIDLGNKGGYVCIDHCYDIEDGFDGGTVWFSTNGGAMYTNFAPLQGYDAVLDAGFGGECEWTYGAAIECFTGSSGGWVTDCWELTDQTYIDNDVSVRFAFGSDGSIVASGWMIDNVTVYRNLGPEGPIDCAYTITPLVGTLPFTITHRVTLANLLSGTLHYTRRIAGRIAVITGAGASFNPWRAGFSNVNPGDTYTTAWNVDLPAHPSVLGINTFTLTVEDVTPAPYNQPPYPPSGTTCTQVNVVVANAP